MRRRTFLLLLALLASPCAWSRSFTASDKPLRPGWWYDPATPGLAFTLSPAGNALAGALLTFDTTGEPVWYLVVGEGDGVRWSLPLTRHFWDVQAQRTGRSETVGNFTFTVEGEERVHASWSIDGASGSATLEPLALAPGYSAEDRSGHWFSPADPGHGFTFLSQGAFLAAVHYAFDAQGNPRWFYGDNGGVRDRGTLDAVYFRKPCATCEVSVHAAGTMDVRFDNEYGGRASVALDIPAPSGSRWSRGNLGLELISDLPSGRAHPTALAHFANTATLTDYLREAAPNTSLGIGFCFTAIDFSPREATSSTNVQEEGVDEADFVDADGEYVYSVFPSTGDRPQRLRTHRLRPEAADLDLLSDIDLVAVDEAAPAVSGLYLVETAGGPRRLVVVRGQDSGYVFFAPRCGPQGNSRTEVEIYELGDRGRPTLLHRLAFEGGLVASRRIGRELIVVTRYRPQIPGLVYDASTPSDRANNAALLDAQSLATLAPRSTLDLGVPQPLVAPATTWLPPLPPGEREASLLTVTSVPLDDPAARSSLTLVGTDDGAYVSSSSLYLATSRNPASFDGSRFAYPEEFATDFHRVALAPLAYRASGTAPGSLGGSIDQKPFRMSEYAGHFRAITELSGQRPANGRYRLAVFAENAATLRLDEVAHLPNEELPQPIGKPDEFLYAVRFAGERAYAVTFLSIDPLYTIDLSDPLAPRLSGELQMPGYSAYLHPLGARGLVGIGKDAVPAERGGDDSSFAWYQGLLLASFDVSDATAPRRVASRDLGRRGSESALLHDHHALAFAPVAGGTTRLAFPVTIHDALSASQVSSDPTTYYPFRYSGLATFEVDTTGTLIDRGTLIAARAEDADIPPELLDGTDARALLVGDAVYLYQGGWWLGARWGTPEQHSPRR